MPSIIKNETHTFKEKIEARWQSGFFVCVGLDVDYPHNPQRVSRQVVPLRRLFLPLIALLLMPPPAMSAPISPIVPSTKHTAVRRWQARQHNCLSQSNLSLYPSDSMPNVEISVAPTRAMYSRRLTSWALMPLPSIPIWGKRHWHLF